jgi:D-alanyl-D-alanine carboxypeptidase
MTEGELDCNHLNVENQSANAYLVSKQQPVDVQRDTTNCAYSGSAGPSTLQANTSRAAAMKQHNNVNKGYVNRPNQGGTQIFNQNDNIMVNRKEVERVNNRPFMPGPGGGCVGSCLATGSVPSVETYGKVNTPQYYNECMNCERINPDILTAFKQNPYTQSLASWAAP